MSQTGSVGCLLVWASQCLAFIRYRRWSVIKTSLACAFRPYLHQPDYYRLETHQENLTGAFAKYNRGTTVIKHDQFTSVLSYFQPAVAWLGLIGCLSVVLVFNSASWWNGNVTAKKVAVAYAGVSTRHQSAAAQIPLVDLDTDLTCSVASHTLIAMACSESLPSRQAFSPLLGLPFRRLARTPQYDPTP